MSPKLSCHLSRSAAEYVVYSWNIYFANNDEWGVAKEINNSGRKEGRMPDVFGLNEVPGPWNDLNGLASKVNQVSGMNYKWQSGSGIHNGNYAYGTEIFYDANRFADLEGTKTLIWENGKCQSKGNHRAAHAVALKDRQTGEVLITGGIVRVQFGLVAIRTVFTHDLSHVY